MGRRNHHSAPRKGTSLRNEQESDKWAKQKAAPNEAAL